MADAAEDPVALAAALPRARRDDALYLACRDYVARCDGTGNSDMATNGELALLSATIPSCRVVFDVGAHTGDWTAAALALNPALVVHAFEPSARNAAALRARNFPAGVTIRQFALGAAIERRELLLFGSYGELSSFYAHELPEPYPVHGPDGAETVDVTTLDAYCADHAIGNIDFVKIDVEGHDLKVLQGSVSKLATQSIGMVQFEYGGGNIESRDLLKDFFGFFRNFPYDLYKIGPDGLMPMRAYDGRLENFAYQNWLAVRRAQPGAASAP